MKRKGTGAFVNDRRLSKRYDLPLRLNYRDPDTSRQGEALTKNICRTGLRFSADSKIAKGALLDLAIESPFSSDWIRSKAKVIWAEEFVSSDDAEDIIYEVGVRLFKKRIY